MKLGKSKEKKKKQKSSGGVAKKVDIKKFLSEHAEKLLLGLAGLFALGLLYSGFKSRGEIDTSRSPKDLVTQVNLAEASINQPRWESVYKPQRARNLRLSARATEALSDISADNYPTPMPWKPLVFPPQTKRSDPELFPLQEMLVQAGVAAIGIRRDNTIGSGFRDETPITENTTRSVPSADLAEWEGDRFSEGGGGGTPTSFHFVCVKGLIPFQQQLDEYNKVFQNGSGYNANRDSPHYFTFSIQRAEVSPGGGELQWKDLPRLDKTVIPRLASRPQEIASNDYVIDLDTFRGTNFQLPPMMRQDLERWALHPKIPREELEESYREGPLNEEDSTAADDPFERARRGSLFEAEADYQERGLMEEEEGGYGDFQQKLTDYKLFRYFDYQVTPGKSYRYRVKLWLDDPNDPSEGARALNPQMLSNEVMVRLRQVREQTAKFVHFRSTEWSEPSDMVTVPTGHAMIAGAVTPASRVSIPGTRRKTLKPYDEPSAKVVQIQWDHERAAHVPVEIEVKRGATGYFVKDAEYLPAADARLETLKEYQFQPRQMVVVDIAGGEPLSSRNKEITTPGEIVMFDESGRMIIRNEMDDLLQFKRFTFEPVEMRDKGTGRPRDEEDDGEFEPILEVPDDEKI